MSDLFLINVIDQISIISITSAILLPYIYKWSSKTIDPTLLKPWEYELLCPW